MGILKLILSYVAVTGMAVGMALVCFLSLREDFLEAQTTFYKCREAGQSRWVCYWAAEGQLGRDN